MELKQYDVSFFERLMLFVFMLPNIAYSAFKLIPFGSQLWSVGVEEQFYLIWPYLNKRKSKNLVTILILIILIIVLSKFFLNYYVIHFNSSRFFTVLNDLLIHFRIQCMAIGAIGAYILINNKNEILHFVFSKKTQIITLTLAAICILTPFDTGLYNDEFIATIFIIIILNAAANSNCMFHLENKPFLFLGKISYGIYMYQILAIKISFLIAMHTVGFTNNLLFNTLYYFTAFALTIIISALSYFLIEEKLLKLKSKFSTISSN